MNKLTRKRPQGQFRQTQLITSFGPGAMTDLPERSVLVSGLDFWFGARVGISEPRLSAKIAKALNLATVRLETPPAAVDGDDSPQSGVPAFRFPTWFVSQDEPGKASQNPSRTRFLVPAIKVLKAGKFEHPETRKKLNVVPVRFVRACRNGHIGDIDWFYFLHGNSDECRHRYRQLYMDERGTSGDLSEIVIRCDCGQERSMAQVSIEKAEVFGRCDGARPWLGPRMQESCNELNRLLVRTASNAYFPQRLSVISLPERNESVSAAVTAVWDFLEKAEDEADVARERRKSKVQDALQGITDAEVWAEIQIRCGALTSPDQPVKAAELETLLATTDEIGEDRPQGIFYAKTLPKAEWDRPWMSGIEKVVLVQRLREVTALIGFTRFEAAAVDPDGDVDMGVRRAELARDVTWVPAIENRGEGVFLQFRTEAIKEWMAREAVANRLGQLQRGFQLWKAEHPTSGRKIKKLEYIMLHSFAHLLLTTIALECGYPASSIRERVYAFEQGYGVLLYTGSSDSEGTLGGLVEVGRRIADTIRAALDMGALCSNDPVCSQHKAEDAHERRFLLGAACHGCLLVAETSCEQQNDLLDRALVVRTVQGEGAEFFREPQT